ncbi:MAG: hypothetical protein AAGI24_07240 [Pseudomonadota bacterium]
MSPSVQTLIPAQQPDLWTGTIKLRAAAPSPDRAYYIPSDLRLFSFNAQAGAAFHQTSGDFILPDELGLYVFGQVHHKSIRLALEVDGRRHPLDVHVPSPGTWMLMNWRVPRQLVGQAARMRLDAEQSLGGAIGLSEPFVYSASLRLIKVLIETSRFAWYFALTLLPGLLVAPLLVQWAGLPRHYIPLTSFIVLGLLGYASFWAHYGLRDMGWMASSALYVAPVLLALVLWRRHPPMLRLCDYRCIEVWSPLALMFVLGLAYLSVLQWQDLFPARYARFRFTHQLPIDNYIPWDFARALAGMEPLKLEGQRQFSDRPPLQAGILLLLPRFPDGISHGFRQLAIGVSLQMAWVPAVLLLLRSIGVSARRSMFVLTFCALSGFFVLHSLYVWPKLLAASLCLLCLSVIVQALCQRASCGTGQMLLIATSAGLAMLAHSGSFFLLLPALLLLLHPGVFPGLMRASSAAVIFFCLYGSWSAYQTFIDPPGNRLLRIHLLNDRQPERRSLAEAFEMRKARFSWGGWLSQKSYALQNQGLQQMLSHGIKAVLVSPDIALEQLSAVRRDNFKQTFTSLGFLPLGGLLGGLYCLLRRQSVRAEVWTLSLACVAWGLWLLLVFALHTVHINTFATMLLFFASLGALLTRLPEWLSCSLLAAHCYYFLLYFVVGYSRYKDTAMFMGLADINPWALAVSVSACLAFVVLARRVASTDAALATS